MGTLQSLQVVPGEVLKLGASLRELTVVGNHIGEMPAELDLCRRLRVLNLAANDLSGLPDLSRLRELAHVGLACNRVDDRSLPAVVRCLPASLASLDLGANELCSLESLLSAFEARALPGLRQLYLYGNGLSSLLLPDLPSLAVLSLANNRLTCLPTAALLRLPSLTDLDVARNRLDLPGACLQAAAARGGLRDVSRVVCG